jgi:hypothetical protein
MALTAPASPRNNARRAMLLVAFALAACQGGPHPAVESAATPVVEGEAPAAQGGTTATIATPAVDWAAADGHRQLDPALLPAPARDALAAVPIPALLPPHAELLSSAVVTTGPAWYGAHLPLDGATVYIQGTLATHPTPPGVAATPPDAAPSLTRSHGIVTSSFRAFGVAYTVHVECERPFEDPRCVDDGFIEGLVNGLAVAGGRR